MSDFEEAAVRTYRKLFLYLSLIVLTSGCSSGGGGSPESTSIKTPVGTPINLSEIKSFDEATAAPGTSMAFLMTGTICDTVNCNNLSGILVTTISAPTTSNGQTFHVAKETLSITNTLTGDYDRGTSTSIVSLSGYVSSVSFDYGLEGSPVSQILLPGTAKVGDTGNYTQWNFSDGTAETVAWRMDPGDNGDGIVVFTVTNTDNANAVTYTSVDSYTIKPDGHVSAVSLITHYVSDGITVALSGNRVQWPQSITVAPSNPTIAIGTQQQFAATGTYADQTTKDLTSYVVWSSSTSTVATISNRAGANGSANAVASGSTVITATLGNISDETTLIVVP